MKTEHNLTEMARAYLLGTLPDDVVETVEVSYFLHRENLQEIKAAEERLIEDYLDHALTPDELRQFKARYLRYPALKDLVDQVKRRRMAAPAGRPSSFRPGIWLAWTAALLCVAAVCAWLYLGRSARPRQGVVTPQNAAAPLLSMVTLRLEPGISKGDAVRNARIPTPPDGAPVKLVAELPGERSPVVRGARLSVVRADGAWAKIWSAAPVRTETGHAGQELVLVLPPATLHPGDYVLETTLTDGRVRETYLFRVSPPQ